jgi:class 3 adenylate cyclase
MTPASIVGSVLFTDLVGFTDYNDSRGDAAALDVLEQQRSLADRVLRASPGSRVVKELGDGLMIWFGRADDAIILACELMASIDAARAADRFPLAVRMGLHHGEALARGDDLVGSTVNIAARVCALAGPGELLVSDEALGAGGSGPGALRPIGPAHVKGVSHPVWLHRVG